MILKVFFFLSFLWVDRFDKQRKVPEVTTRWLLADLAAFSHRYFRRVARGRYFRVAKAFIVHGPYEVAIIIRDGCDVWSNVKDVKNNISVKLNAHFVNAVKNIDRQQTIHSTQFNATAAVPPGGRGWGRAAVSSHANRSQTWNLFCWNYNPLSACHAVRQEKRTSKIEAKPCHQTVWTKGMNIELFLFLTTVKFRK